MMCKRYFVALLLSLTVAACSSDSDDNDGGGVPVPPMSGQEVTPDDDDADTPAVEGDPTGTPMEGEDGAPLPGETPTEGDVPPGGDVTPGGEVPPEGEVPVEGEVPPGEGVPIPPGGEIPPGEGEEEVPPVEGEQPPVGNPGGGLIGPSGGLGGGAYVQFNDSPFANVDFSSGYFYLEDFEDQFLEHPGASANTGGFVSDTGLDNHDSVDQDDGVIDGNSLAGESWFRGSGAPSVTWSFNAGDLDGNLPTHAGVVFTDGRGTITFEAFGPSGESLGVVTGDHADSRFDGATAEDRFYGIVNSGGISAIRLSSSDTSFGLELDHLQWGYVAP